MSSVNYLILIIVITPIQLLLLISTLQLQNKVLLFPLPEPFLIPLTKHKHTFPLDPLQNQFWPFRSADLSN